MSQLPGDLPAAVLVVIHLSPDYPSQLPAILSRSGSLPVQHAQHQALLSPGHIYVAPPDHHVLVAHDRLHLSRGPKENRSRPSIDVLFRSAAYTHGAGTIGVLLSGMMDDGTSGMWTIRQLGGRTVVQNPEDALYGSMPLSAVQHVAVDQILPAHAIAPALTRLLDELGPVAEEPNMSDEEWRRLEVEVGIASEDNAFNSGMLNHGSLSTFTCPECHGVLVQIREGRIMRFRCHTGHAYTADTLLSELRGSVEGYLWQAARTLDEDVMLLEHLSKHADEADQTELAAAYRQEAQVARARGRRMRQEALQAGEDKALPVETPPGP
ncbi:chemotaxis protein CheB [Deinococcus sonorensis]|uniref:protein-glutamate methylesterase n=1 Tax=Deinococcus sonorensis KR-87 TaxID=694439 RepID=A0AAU7UE88_9DEIO